MKQNSYVLRNRIFICAMVLLIGVLSTGTSGFAKSFSITGKKVSTITQPTYLAWQITGLSPVDTLYLSITVVNPDQTLIVNPTNYVKVYADSTKNKMAWLSANYVGGTNTVFTSYIIIDDGNGSIDTLTINASDNRFNTQERPFDLYSPNDQWGRNTTWSFGSFYYTTPETQVTLAVNNYSGSDLDLTASLENSTGDFELDQTSFTVPGPGGAVGSHEFHVVFKPTTHTEDSVLVIVRSSGVSGRADTLMLIALDSMADQRPNIPVDSILFENRPFGSTTCGFLTIVNPYNYPLTITKASWIDYQGVFTVPTITVPFTMAAHTTDSIEVCFNAPSSFGTRAGLELHLEFTGLGSKTGVAYLSAIGTTVGCISITPKTPHVFEPTLIGGYTELELVVTNNHPNRDVVVNSVAGSGDNFMSIVSPSFPFTVPMGSKIVAKARFAPTSGNYSTYRGDWSFILAPNADSMCGNEFYQIYGTVLNPYDTLKHVLFSDQLQVLPMRSDKNSTTKTFQFVNNGSVSLKVSNVYVVNGTHFTVSAPKQTDLPITLAPGNTLDVDLTFDANTTGFYTDSLVIVTDKALTNLSFHIQAIRTGVASVDPGTTGPATFTIVPNPAQAIVTIRSATVENVTMEIFDELGNSVATHSGSEWVFNTKDVSNYIASGSYFVRISGIDATGKTTVQTKRLVIR